jgi:hypothetical protein
MTSLLESPTGHRAAEPESAAELLGLEIVEVRG